METIQKVDDKSCRLKKLNRFIAKTYLIVNSDEPTTCWVNGGKSFVIIDPKIFSETVLPKYFKHNKLTSFVRQLNFYGFHKIRIDPKDLIASEKLKLNGANLQKLKMGDIVCFHHKFFQANQRGLLQNIQRATKHISPTMNPELLLSDQQKEMEDIQNQLREMRESTALLRDEFEKRLAGAKAELQIDYLHRIKALEVCYKDLLLIILKTREPSPMTFPIPNTSMNDSAVTGTNTFPPSSQSSSSSSSSSSSHCSGRSLRGPNYDAREQMVEQKIDRLSPLPQDDHRQNIVFGDKHVWPNMAVKDSSAWLRLNQESLRKGKQIHSFRKQDASRKG